VTNLSCTSGSSCPASVSFLLLVSSFSKNRGCTPVRPASCGQCHGHVTANVTAPASPTPCEHWLDTLSPLKRGKPTPSPSGWAIGLLGAPHPAPPRCTLPRARIGPTSRSLFQSMTWSPQRVPCSRCQ
jgi:hypothetical protein